MSIGFPLLLILPLLGAALCYLFQHRLRIQFGLSSISYGVQIAVCLSFLGAWQQGSNILLSFGGWPKEFAINFFFDPLSALLIGVSSFVFLCGSFFLLVEQSQKRSSKHVFTILSFLQLGINGAFLTADLFNLFVFFEVLLIAGLVLLILTGSSSSRKAAASYLGLNFLASAFFLLGIGIIYQQTGTLNFQVLNQSFPLIDPKWQLVSAAFIFVSFATKAALFPFYFWLPRAYPELPGALGGIFGGLLTKVGLYALLRVSFLLFPQGSPLFWILLFSAIASMLLGVFAAYSQKEIKKILSFHIISQVGYIAGGIALAGLVENQHLKISILAATIFYFVHHILVKANLFFASSWIQILKNTTLLPKIQGLQHKRPLLSFFFAVPALSLAGLPPFSGFWAKLSIVRGAFLIENWPYIMAALAAGLMTFLSMLKIWNQCFLGENQDENEQAINGPTWLWSLGAGLMVGATLFISFYPSELFYYSQIAAESFIGGIGINERIFP